MPSYSASTVELPGRAKRVIISRPRSLVSLSIAELLGSQEGPRYPLQMDV